MVKKVMQKVLIAKKQPPDVLYQKAIIKNFAIFAGLQVSNFIKKRLQHGCFPANIAKCEHIF